MNDLFFGFVLFLLLLSFGFGMWYFGFLIGKNNGIFNIDTSLEVWRKGFREGFAMGSSNLPVDFIGGPYFPPTQDLPPLLEDEHRA